MMKRLLFLLLLMSVPCVSLDGQIRHAPLHARSVFRADTVSVVMIGDVMLHSAEYDNAHILWQQRTPETERQSVPKHWQYDFSGFFSDIARDLRDADLAVANMEFSLGGQISGYPCFSAPDSYADYVAGLGVDVFLTANNHIMDRGPSGAARTLEYYTSGGLRYTGSGLDRDDFRKRNPLMVSVHGIRLAFINFTYDVNCHYQAEYPRIFMQDDVEEIKEAVERARANGADVVVAMPHWGEEFKHIHSTVQHKLAVMLADAGVDVVIGAHPHVVQDRELIMSGGRNVQVYYSIGNAVSNMTKPGTQLELMVRMDVVRDGNGDVKVLPLSHEWLWCSRPGDIGPGFATVRLSGPASDPSLWKNTDAYDNMAGTFARVSALTGLDNGDGYWDSQ